MKLLILFILFVLIGPGVRADQAFFYVTGSDGIYRDSIDINTGKLGALSMACTVKDPNFLALSPGSKKELLVWVWYPAAPSPKNVPAEYLPSLWRAAVAKQEGMLMRSFFKHDPALVQTHSVSGAALSSEQRSFSIRKPILNSGSCPIQRIGRGCWIAMRAG